MAQMFIEKGDSAEGGSATLEFDSSLSAAVSWWRIYAAVLVTVDMVALGVGAATARLVGFNPVPAQGSARVVSAGQMTLLMVLAWVVVMALNGTYQRRCIATGSEEYRRVFVTGARFFAVLAVAAFVFDAIIGRGFVAVTVPVAVLCGIVLRYAIRHWLHGQRGRGRFTRSVLVVGSEDASRELLHHFSRSPHAGFRPIAACISTTAEVVDVDGTLVPVLTTPDRVLDAALICRADAIAVADATTLPGELLRRLAWQLEGTGIAIMVSPAVTDFAGPRISVRPTADLPLLHVEEPKLRAIDRVCKAAFDRVLSALILLGFSPVLIVSAIAIKLTSRGPVLFKQVRVGLGGRRFVIWKFRTMRRDAELRLADVAHLNEHDGLLFKMRDDPRVTRVGRFLRRWSLDELPQLVNVLRGDMSLIGPRPPLPCEVQRYDDQIRRRLLVKPGMTGLWQVSGRAGLSWQDAIRLDLEYVENWSMSMDAVILARTALAVVKRNGAY